MSRETGGPAFPQAGAISEAGDVWQSSELGGAGLSLRDYFASRVMQGVFASGTTLNIGSSHKDEMDNMACAFYLMADAMLESRNKAEEEV